MIKAVLFDLGGTLHKSSSPPGRDLWFAQRLIERFSDYGIKLEGGAELLAGRLAINSEVYKHESEVTLRELPSAQIWSDYYLREYGLERERIEPFAEELSFLYDYERPCVMRREHLKETMMELKAMGLHLGVISNIISRSVVRHFLAEYGIEALMDCVITSAETGIRKPSPEIFRIAEKAMGLKPEELCYGRLGHDDPDPKPQYRSSGRGAGAFGLHAGCPDRGPGRNPVCIETIRMFDHKRRKGGRKNAEPGSHFL